MPDLTVCVCTFNSAATLERCLSSILRSEPGAPIIVIDQQSTDSSADIALRFGAEVHLQHVGLGFARQMGFDLVATRFLAFVDSDEEIVQTSFFKRARAILEDPGNGAVVGMGLGHRFAYGLPMGLLVLRSADFKTKVIPKEVNAREEYYVGRRLKELGLATVFVPDAMIHKSQFRQFKPEWEGANTRIVAGLSLGQLLFIMKVIILQSLNSRSLRNVVYVPVFYLKFLRGFVQPQRWRQLRTVKG